MKCGQILLVAYPFTDLHGSKFRPALVVSADAYNQGDDFVVVPISSAPEPDDPYSFHIPTTASFFDNTGLRQASSVKWTKPLTISRRVVQRLLGTLTSAPLSEIQFKMQSLFET